MNLFEKARRYYEKSWWTLATLEALVEKGKLTQEQVAEITCTSTEAESEPSETPEQAETDLSAMAKAELLAYAQERGIEAYESWTKAEIIAAIESAA